MTASNANQKADSNQPCDCISEGLSVVIPCYNEAVTVVEETVRSLIEVLQSIDSLRFEIILVDDGSQRYTYSELASRHGVRLLRHKVNRGYGASLASGIRNAGYPWIATIDADGTYPCADLPKLIEGSAEYNMVIGARAWKDIHPLRRLPKSVLTLLASYLANHQIPDLNSGMRVFHRRIYDDHWRIYPESFSFSSTLTMTALTYLHDVLFIPIPYFKRIGRSSIKPLRDTIRFFYQLLRLSLYFRPLRFFLPCSAACGLLAVARGLRDYGVQGSFGGLTLILFFMAFQIFFFGLIAEISSKK